MAQKRKRRVDQPSLRLSPEEMARTVHDRQVRLTHSWLVANKPQWVGRTNVVDAHLFVMIERGALRMKLESSEVMIPTGCVCWIPPGTFRTFEVASGVPCQSWRVRLSIQEDGEEVGLDCGPLLRADGGSILPHIQLMNDVGRNKTYREEIKPLTSAFMLRFLALPELSENSSRQLNAVQRRRVEQLVKRGLLVGVTPTDMADEVGLSPDYFTRLFKATYGIPPRRYLLEQRMELAGQILRDSRLSVKEVCAELGEPDVGTFCRLFKRVTGRTPTQFRKTR